MLRRKFFGRAHEIDRNVRLFMNEYNTVENNATTLRIRAALDLYGSMGLPLWLTEVSVDQGPYQGEYLEQILREGYSHPAVEGIIMFGGPEEAGYKELTLADYEFMNTEAGDVVDRLLGEWKSPITEAEADEEGFCEASLFYGDYEIAVRKVGANSVTSLISYKLSSARPGETVVHLRVG
ncbi:unnamed protein product [Linum tenue]|uniref:Uncharacterized protein n=1 Tax=Linum tenue TaxID=586396 RepID=A0AAV0PIT8_9ROSI|nr:unnamed protein product [Linum tenue]